jgi:esterase
MDPKENFFVKQYGQSQNQAETIIFIHGLLGWGLNWSPIIKYFESKYHVVTYDQRGHGRAYKPDHGYQPENYADDLLSIMNSLDLKTAHIVGHSMGARTAQNFAVRHPGRCRSLTLEDMGPQPETESTLSTQQMILSVPVPFKTKADVDIYFEKKFKVKTASEDTQKQVMANFLKANLLMTSNFRSRPCPQMVRI